MRPFMLFLTNAFWHGQSTIILHFCAYAHAHLYFSTSWIRGHAVAPVCQTRARWDPIFKGKIEKNFWIARRSAVVVTRHFLFFSRKKIKVGTFYHFIFVKLELTKDLCYYVNILDTYSWHLTFHGHEFILLRFSQLNNNVHSFRDVTSLNCATCVHICMLL
jgi:hypothetical protein